MVTDKYFLMRWLEKKPYKQGTHQFSSWINRPFFGTSLYNLKYFIHGKKTNACAPFIISWKQRFFAKIPSNQSFTKELYCKLIWREKICVAVPSTVWKDEYFSLTKFFPWNHFFSKTIVFTKFLRKKCERLFHSFHYWEKFRENNYYLR